MSIAYIGIGSNLGDPQSNCDNSLKSLNKMTGIKVLARSQWRISQALTAGDPDYINGAAKIETSLGPLELLKTLQGIELEMGRVRSGKKWEPRIIDLDILFYDDLVIDTPELKVPHPEAHKRTFVLEPLCDIAPQMVHPVLGRTVMELLTLN